MSDGDPPWARLPRTAGVPMLKDARSADSALLDGLFELPAGSALTVAEVAADGSLVAARWRGTGETLFYPASTIKWTTGALAVALMDEHDLPPEAVLAVGDRPAATLRDLVLSMLQASDNDAFNALHEWVGTAETHAAMRSWGCTHAIVRRHFMNPRFTGSPACVARRPDGSEVVFEAKPEVDMPLSTDRPPPDGNPEANAFTTDDLVRVGAATLMGPIRDAAAFGLFACGLSWTCQAYVRAGLARLTAGRPDRPGFVVLNKPGWWPPDGANSELNYVHDVAHGRHLFLAVYAQGTEAEAEAGVSAAAEAVGAALLAGRLRLA
ncbi:serine hydrolase [Phycisphaera mikurensis]|uniref:Beta-lactamase class A catalytic domain-containing protein n=1 Tax=Phycisphaera mikurensis (strain NBRC 102666 / KCTC 22515 / FYK2301M01) TaxID=1142394 RepID=I0IDW5_PHYMF|nr:serine hydrolase [Phycisphaera mikurensis]MBB6441260.1 hypothetical protein [Phycisphaera mikurensis]BAM03453.1 hypothetical protein PSMK_12940 [Phycisphaera mikurensis NBRC 102666]